MQEEEEEGGLTPADDEDAAKRKINRKEFNFLIGDQYQPIEYNKVRNFKKGIEKPLGLRYNEW